MARHLAFMFLKRGDEVLLGVKKRGFGQGKINGPGGKVEPGETYKHAAIRETEEEVGIHVKTCEEMGQIIFRDLYFSGKPETNILHVYMSEDFEGEPVETDELAPQWYKINAMPYNQMWGDDEHWMPEVFKGNKVDAYFHFNEMNDFTDYKVNLIPDKCIAKFRDSDFSFPEDKDEDNFEYRDAARAVLVDENYRVALIDATNRGYYKLPGGGIDDGELIEEALKREVLEEAGYEIELLCPLGYTHETRHKFEQFNRSYAWLARATKQTERNLMEDEKEDGFEVRWFNSIDDAIAAVENVDTSNMIYQAHFFTARELAILREARNVLKEKYGQ